MSVLRFQKFSPSPGLLPFVKFLYHIEVDKQGQTYSNATINHPQGGVDLIIVINGRLGLQSGTVGQGEDSGVFLVGQQCQHFSFSFKPETSLFGAVFYPAGAHRWLNIPVSEATNTLRPLRRKEINGDLSELKGKLTETYMDCRDLKSVVQLLDGWLVRNQKHTDLHIQQMDKGLSVVHQLRGSLPANELCDLFSVSKRTLQRRFKDYYGLSPKQYLDIVRFNHMMKIIQQTEEPDWAELIYKGGYYDQSHFIKVFQKMTGNTPQTFISERPPLAEYFLHI